MIQPTMTQVIRHLTVKQEIKRQTDALARQLIHELNIQYGDNLYFHLGLYRKCDNYTAVRDWVKDNCCAFNCGDFDDSYQMLKKNFLALITKKYQQEMYN